MSAPANRRIEFIAVAVIALFLIVVFPLLNGSLCCLIRATRGGRVFEKFAFTGQ